MIPIVGAALSLYLHFLVRLPIVAKVLGRHIAYISSHFSSHRSVRWFDAAALISFASAYAFYAFYAFWFISVWSDFAALLRGLILIHFPRHRAFAVHTVPADGTARLPPSLQQGPARIVDACEMVSQFAGGLLSSS